jgi:hypothetical protein
VEDSAPSSDEVVRRSVDVTAPPEVVWDLVSDLPGMGRFSPEATGGAWTGGHAGPAVGAVFAGRNARGRRTWSTRSRVVACEPGRVFAFEVSSLGLPVAEWRYDIAPTAAGCHVTETWTDRRGAVIRVVGGLATGVRDRRAYAASSIEHTLDRIKAAAEGKHTDAA